MKCGAPLDGNEIAMHKKLINRFAEEFMCLDCLSEHFNVSRELLEEKIDYFIKTGCTLFPENQI